LKVVTQADPQRPTALAAITVTLFAASIRLLWWRWAHGPLNGGDSSRYLDFASRMAHGDFTALGEWPFHQLYSVTLTPMFVLPVSRPEYLAFVHITVSSLTVLLMYLTAVRLAGRTYGLVVGALASLYVPFLFWMPYVLTETTFLFTVALYVWASAALLMQPNARTSVIWAVAAALFIVGRPSGPPVAALTFLVLACYFFARWRGPRPALIAGISIVVLAGVAFATALSTPAIRQRILRMPTVVQSLWVSTKVSTGNMAETRALGLLDEQVDRLFLGAPPEAKTAYKINDAREFIERNPGTYVGMALEKLFAFWIPWAFTDAWSRAHRAVDAAISLSLTIGLLLTPWTSIRRSMLWLIAVMTVAFAVLSAFSQIDPDGRYRVPAELPVLLVAPAGWLWLLTTANSVVKFERRSPNDGS
jgi:hypothetical protein